MLVDGVKEVGLDSMYVAGFIITIRLHTLALQKYMRSFHADWVYSATPRAEIEWALRLKTAFRSPRGSTCAALRKLVPPSATLLPDAPSKGAPMSLLRVKTVGLGEFYAPLHLAHHF